MRPVVAMALVACAGLFTGCVSSVLIEAEHVSHPGAGWPVGPADQEAQLTHGGVLLRWRRGGWYADAGLGVKLYERHPRDFVGPTITGTVRVGHEFVIKGEQ